MARPKSVILTPTELKQAVGDVKARLKLQKDAIKATEKQIKDVEKAYVGTMKTLDKAMLAHGKNLTKIEAELEKLSPPKAAASPTA